ncbi:MAG: hypothetical protein QF718_04055 [Phycisphaerales bacterium]|jgi:hypothetical protein|nr:hypothetical protein [Phycisphaerales bacterium]
MIDKNTIRGPLGWGLASIVVICIFCIYAFITVLSPLLLSSSSNEIENKTDSLIEKHDEYALIDISRFKGRSAFFKPIRKPPPPPPPPPPPANVPEPEDSIIDPGPPPPPDDYRGPDFIAIIGEEAWFRSSGSGFGNVIRIKVGEEKDGLKVVSTTAPSIVKVEYLRGEYDLDLFERDEPFFLENPPPSTSVDFLEEVDGN